VKTILKTVQPDLLHAHYAAGYGTLGRLSDFHPYIVSVWGSDVFEVPERSPVHEFLITKNLASADQVCSTSIFMAEHTRKYYMGRITVTPFGVDCQRFRPLEYPDQNDEFVIGTVKSLEQPYGLEHLIRAFALLTNKYHKSKHIRLVIAGDGTLRHKLQKLAEHLNIAGSTEFLGNVPQEQLPALLSRFTLFVIPSVFETFGVAVLEASACGLSVVASNLPGLCEVLEPNETALLAPAGDEVATANAMFRLLENKPLRKAMGAAGRKFVLGRYQWLDTAVHMEQLYESIVSPKPYVERTLVSPAATLL